MLQTLSIILSVHISVYLSICLFPCLHSSYGHFFSCYIAPLYINPLVPGRKSSSMFTGEYCKHFEGGYKHNKQPHQKLGQLNKNLILFTFRKSMYLKGHPKLMVHLRIFIIDQYKIFLYWNCRRIKEDISVIDSKVQLKNVQNIQVKTLVDCSERLDLICLWIYPLKGEILGRVSYHSLRSGSSFFSMLESGSQSPKLWAFIFFQYFSLKKTERIIRIF